MNTPFYAVVRSESAGAFLGLVKEFNEELGFVKMDESRRLWYWSGAASLSQLAAEGVKNPDECKFPCEINDHTVLGVCEVIKCTDEAVKIVKSVPVWSAKTQMNEISHAKSTAIKYLGLEE